MNILEEIAAASKNLDTLNETAFSAMQKDAEYLRSADVRHCFFDNYELETHPTQARNGYDYGLIFIELGWTKVEGKWQFVTKKTEAQVNESNEKTIINEVITPFVRCSRIHKQVAFRYKDKFLIGLLNHINELIKEKTDETP